MMVLGDKARSPCSLAIWQNLSVWNSGKAENKPTLQIPHKAQRVCSQTHPGAGGAWAAPGGWGPATGVLRSVAWLVSHCEAPGWEARPGQLEWSQRELSTAEVRDQNTQETALAVGKYWEKKLLEIHYSDTQGYCIQSLRIGFYLFF